MQLQPASTLLVNPDANAIYYTEHEDQNELYTGRVGSFRTLPLGEFIGSYPSLRGNQLIGMKGDFHLMGMKDIPVYHEGYLDFARIERAIHRFFPVTNGIDAHRIIVTDKSVLTLFPPLIKDSPFVSSERLNRSLWSLPIQIMELFARTLLDLIIYTGLSVYSLVDQDRAEYLKVRLSITHNNAQRAIWTNIYSHF